MSDKNIQVEVHEMKLHSVISNNDLESNSKVSPMVGTAKVKNIDADRSEIGGPKGPEPTRYGDWEVNGRCSDF